MTDRNDERGAELRELFFESAQELLQALNDGALQLEKQPGDSEIVRAIRRAVHTLKGDAAACGYRDLSEIAHKMEDALALQSACSDASLVEVVLSAADLFSAMLRAYRQGEKPPASTALRTMIRKLAAATPDKKPGRGRKTAAKNSFADRWTEYERLAIGKALAAGRNLYHARVSLDPRCALPLAAKQLVFSALTSLKPCSPAFPADPPPQPIASTTHFLFMPRHMPSSR